MASVELKGLTKRFGPATAVDNVSLTIGNGNLVCLLGPSGCGKTTTLRLIAGFIEPTEGEIVVGDRVVSSPRRTLPPEQRKMSMIFQSYALWPHMTAAENVAYGLKIRGLDKATVDARVKAILVVARLEALADRYPSELSGGQQQRVSLARALVVEPETLLMDEPLSNLDANLREEMRFEIRRLHDQFCTTAVYVTHDQAEAMTTADLIAVMNGGRIEQLGSPEEVYERPVSEFVARFIGASNVLKGRAIGRTQVSIGGVPVATTGITLEPGRETAVTIHQHDIRLAPAGAGVPPANTLPGVVRRQVFLGSSRHYIVEIQGGAEVRIAAPADQSISPGSAAWMHFDPAKCRALAR